MASIRVLVVEDSPTVRARLCEVLATDPGSTKDFTAWTKTTGHELVESSVDGNVFRYLLRKK